MINNLSRDELVDDMKMTIMNWVECPAVKPYSQCELLIEAKYDVQKESKDTKGDKTEYIWWNREFASCFAKSCDCLISHDGRLLLTFEKF